MIHIRVMFFFFGVPEKARLQAEAKEAEEARRKAEAEAANWNLKEKQPAKLCLS